MQLSKLDSTVFAEMLALDIDDLPDATLQTAYPSLQSNFSILEEAVMSKVLNATRPLNMSVADHHEFICKLVADAYNEFKNTEEYASCVSKLSNIANTLGAEAIHSFNMLSAALNEVDTLEEEIKDDTNKQLSAEGWDGGKFKAPATEFKSFDWNRLLVPFGGVKEISKLYQDITGHTPLFTTADAVSMTTRVDGQLTNVDMNSETYQDCVARIAKAAHLDVDTAKQYFDIMTNNTKLSAYVAKLYTRDLSESRLTTAAMHLREVLPTLLAQFSAIRKTPLNVADSTMNTLQENADKVLRQINLAAYALLSLRKKFEEDDIVLVDNDVVNEDVTTEAADNGEPVSEEDLHDYVTAYYSDGKEFPHTGIALSAVTFVGNRSRELVEKKYQAKARDYAGCQKRATVNATRKVLTKYANTLSSNTPGSNKQRIDNLSRNLFSDADNNLQSSLYEFVLDTKYGSPTLKQMHHRFEELTSQAIKDAPEGVPQSRLDLIEHEVAAETNIGYLNSKFFKH